MARYGDVVWAWECQLNVWWPSAIIDPKNLPNRKRREVLESYCGMNKKDIYIVCNYGLNQYEGLAHKHLRRFQAGLADVEARLQPMAKKKTIEIKSLDIKMQMRHWFLVGKAKEKQKANI